MHPSRNYTIDVFRLLGAFAVVALHCSYGNVPKDWVMYGKLCLRWAVPFFFLVSGYYFEQRYRLKPDKTFLSTLTKLISVFFTANLIYALFLFCTDQPRFFALLINRTIAQGFYFHLWFLGSMLIGYLLLLFLMSKKLEKLFPFLILLFLAYNLAADTYNHLLPIQLNHEFARMVLSVPFLLIGFLISKHELPDKLNNLWVLVLLFLFGLMAQLLEASWLRNIGWYDPFFLQFSLGTIPLSLGVFFLSLKLTSYQDTVFSKAGRKYSLLIYLYHPIINVWLLYCLKQYPFTGIPYLYWISPFLVFGATSAILILLHKRFPALYKIIS